MLNKLNTVVGLNVLWYPDSKPGWIDEDFIGQYNVPAVVKFVGKVAGKTGDWVGIALERPGLLENVVVFTIYGQTETAFS